MLTSFRVANHRSIRDEQELLFMPAYDKGRQVVPVTALFGANASGKSNLLDGLRFMQDAVRASYARWEAGAGVPRTPFRLDKALSEPSLYSVEIIVDEVRYTYGFTVDSDRVLEEWLYTYPHRRRRVVFERDGDSIQLGSTIPDQRSRTDVLSALTRTNSLLLTVCAQANQQEVMPVYEWFRTGLGFADDRDNDAVLARITQKLATDNPARSTLVQLVRAADLGIMDIRVERARMDVLAERLAAAQARHAEANMASTQADRNLRAAEREAKRSPSQSTRDRVESAWEAARAREMDAQMAAETSFRIEREIRALQNRSDLVFLHGDDMVPLTLNEQSDGTRAWMNLAIGAMDSLEQGGVFVVDEVDASLHPALTAQLVDLFQNPSSNSRAAQLLFTTHDTSLLGTSLGEDILQRDQIWFVEKDEKGRTKAYPLTDFYPRKQENTQRRYLGGSYGAVPFLSGSQFLQALRSGEAS